MQLTGARRRLLQISKLLFTPVALAFLIVLLWQSRDTLAVLTQNIDAAWLVVSAVCWLSMYLTSPLFTLLVLRALGDKESYWLLAKIFIARLPAKYLPGGVWQTVARGYDLKQGGISTGNVTQLLIYEVGMPILGASTVGAVLLLAAGQQPGSVNVLLIATLIVAIAAFCLAPFAHRFRVLRLSPLALSDYAGAVACLLVQWSLTACSFSAFMLALNIESLSSSPATIAGAYAVSWVVGYVALFAPQGLGVLEYIAQLLIDLPLATAAGLSVIFCFRLLPVCLDMLAWLVLGGAELAHRALRKR